MFKNNFVVRKSINTFLKMAIFTVIIIFIQGSLFAKNHFENSDVRNVKIWNNILSGIQKIKAKKMKDAFLQQALEQFWERGVIRSKSLGDTSSRLYYRLKIIPGIVQIHKSLIPIADKMNNSEKKAILYLRISRAISKTEPVFSASLINKAIGIVLSLKKKGNRNFFFFRVEPAIKALASKNRVLAQQIIKSIKNPFHKAYAFNGFFASYLEKEPRTSLKTLDKLLFYTRRIPTDQEKVIMLNKIIHTVETIRIKNLLIFNRTLFKIEKEARYISTLYYRGKVIYSLLKNMGDQNIAAKKRLLKKLTKFTKSIKNKIKRGEKLLVVARFSKNISPLKTKDLLDEAILLAPAGKNNKRDSNTYTLGYIAQLRVVLDKNAAEEIFRRSLKNATSITNIADRSRAMARSAASLIPEMAKIDTQKAKELLLVVSSYIADFTNKKSKLIYEKNLPYLHIAELGIPQLWDYNRKFAEFLFQRAFFPNNRKYFAFNAQSAMLGLAWSFTFRSIPTAKEFLLRTIKFIEKTPELHKWYRLQYFFRYAFVVFEKIKSSPIKYPKELFKRLLMLADLVSSNLGKALIYTRLGSEIIAFDNDLAEKQIYKAMRNMSQIKEKKLKYDVMKTIINKLTMFKPKFVSMIMGKMLFVLRKEKADKVKEFLFSYQCLRFLDNSYPPKAHGIIPTLLTSIFHNMDKDIMPAKSINLFHKLIKQYNR